MAQQGRGAKDGRDGHGVLDRRSVLGAATGAVVLAPLAFAGRAEAADGGGAGEESLVVTGRLAAGAADFVYLPVEVPDGVPAIGNSDAHSEPQVIGSPHTVVLADDLTRHDVLAGIRAGRCWIAESAAVGLEFTVAGGGRAAGIGERLTVPAATPVDVRLAVTGVPGGTVRLLTDEGRLHQESLPASGTGTVVWRTTASPACYVRAEVRHPKADGSPGRGNAMGPDLPWGPMAALTNPVFLEVRG